MAGDAEWEVEEEGEVEKLESDVREMCKKISEYRQTTLTDPLPSLKPLTISAEAEVPLVLLGTEEQECGQRKIQLHETVSRNAANIPILVKRMRECVEEGIHKLDSLNRRTIPPAFRKKPRIIIP
ncbi:Uncharacterized protein Rs2_41752 [Raphanus sativus]|uniref:Uncharacterized protein LOC108825071 n=1 Tax=Raphanus sativus TaxID=3726 RepID=A0A6J0L386_RAPSA|nr:uncharacterized protein LOC108825071 [Raphanus sativus]KAJ4876734.1 Uncharacterized protein Rs2_41752 [Raphanus sativus]